MRTVTSNGATLDRPHAGEPAGETSRMHVIVRGAVQGVGFRPFVYRLATEMGLPGWVNNSSQGVFIEVEGTHDALDAFLARLKAEKPPRSLINTVEQERFDPIGYESFEIRESDPSGGKSALILPDIATCPDCLAEVFDPSDRRYLYPFTNCTNCGPRFTIIEDLPYDRPNTTMKHFTMCPNCQAEYDDPLNRRFHAQPNACPDCGPQLQLWTPHGDVLSRRHNALIGAAMAIREGAIVAMKGIGGFLLLADGRDPEVVRQLRERKHREEKPLALMYPSLEAVSEHCEVSEAEAKLLCSPEAPIVLLRKRPGCCELAQNIALGNPYVGAMLPYSPLHHLLMVELGFPVVATSGNISDEPICTDEHEALERLKGIADLFLVHDRPIARHADDSVVRVLMGREMVIRRARGYAPMPVALKQGARDAANADPPPVLAVGGHLKNSVAMSVGTNVFISQHIGDLETIQATEAFERVIGDFQRLYDARPSLVVRDAHPDYLSTRYAENTGLPVHSVQHHVAHVLSCMAENEIDGPALGVSWDGTGYGTDGTIWGGEFFRVPAVGTGEISRAAHLRTFRLPGGDKAVKEPRRSAIGVLYELLSDRLTSRERLSVLGTCIPEEIAVWASMMNRGVNAPVTSSAGRLFDAVAALVGLRARCSFEGQAAMELEFAANRAVTSEFYGFKVVNEHTAASGNAQMPMVVDWASTIYEVMLDLYAGEPVLRIAARFHNTLVEMIVEVARLVGEKQVVLSGGCFQNAYLLGHTVRRLQKAGYQPYWHRHVPTNDGGIALGQIAAVMREIKAHQAPDTRSTQEPGSGS